MRILLTSDLHGLEDAALRFAKALTGRYDVGVIAGDLLDDQLTEAELSVLPRTNDAARDMAAGLLAKERRVVQVLKTSGKPVLVVPGNHDTTPLRTDGTFINLHLKKLELDGVIFVGYGCISRSLGPDLQMASLNEIEHLVTERAILVTHIPPRGTLDLKRNGDRMESFGSGILAELISRQKPRFHFFGDAHDSVGVRGTSINASYPLVASFCGIDTETVEIWTERLQ